MRKTKRVTIKDIAELAGVSKATASLVLNGRSKELRVAEETRDRVMAIAKQHHYQPHGKIMNIPVNKGFPDPSKGTPDPSRTSLFCV